MSEKLANITVVLVHPKFPENIGSTARAMANMGCSKLVLVAPQRWNMEAALPLATPKGAPILRQMRIEPDLPAALAGLHTVFATTARTGGWRKGVLTAARGAGEIGELLGQGHEIGIVFGPEDRGLSNEDISISGRLLCIPTADDASSLNLSQAVLVILYECLKCAPGKHFRPGGPSQSRPASHAEQEALYENMQETLVAIDFLKGDNPDYWMMPVRRFLQRVGLRRNEFNLLMGICRQVRWMAGRIASMNSPETPDISSTEKESR